MSTTENLFLTPDEKKVVANYEKACGLVLNEGFPIYYEDDGVTEKQRRYGDFKLNGSLFGCRSGYNKDGSHRKGCSYKNEYVFDFSLYDIYMKGIYLMGDGNNLRTPYYKPTSHDINVTLLFYRHLLLETNHGCSIIADNVIWNSKNGTVSFTIPHRDYPENATQEEIDSIERYNKCYGRFDGSHLTSLCATFAKAVIEGKVDGVTIDDLKNCTIRYTIYEFDDTVSPKEIAYICNAKNTMVPQEKVDIDSQTGLYQPVMPLEIRSGVEERDGAAKYAKEVHKDSKKNSKNDDSDNVSEEDTYSVYKNALVSMQEYFRNIMLVYSAATSRQTFNNNKSRNIYESCRKGDGVWLEQTKKIVTETMDYSRSKDKARKAVRNDLVNSNSVVFNSFLKSSSFVDFWKNCYDYVLSYDYSDVPEEIRKVLSINPVKQNFITPFQKDIVKYSIPLLVRNMIIACYGYLCEFTPNVEGDTLDCKVDFKQFWDMNHNEVIKFIYDCRTNKKNDSTDSFCYVRPTNSVAVTMWYNIYNLCKTYSDKRVNKSKSVTKVKGDKSKAVKSDRLAA